MLKALSARVGRLNLRKALPSGKVILTGLMMLLVGGMALADGPNPANDMLKDVLPNVTTNFGPSSSFAIILYIVEILVGVGGYIKTKNLFMLVGIVVVVTFTAGAFAMIQPAVV